MSEQPDSEFFPRPTGEASHYRSSAVAKMIRLPVATLRIWERRYRLTAPSTEPSGHRLYSAADVQRLALLKQLTDLGHSIGGIAAMDVKALREVAATHVRSLAIAKPAPGATAAAWRVAIVGDGLLRRLQSSTLLRPLGRKIQTVISFGSVAEAAMATTALDVDCLLVEAAGLHPQWLPDLKAGAAALQARRVAVIYGYSAAPTISAFEAEGVVLVHGRMGDRKLAEALRELGEGAESVPRQAAAAVTSTALSGPSPSASMRGHDHASGASSPDAPLPSSERLAPPPRYHDAMLADLASLSTTLACECPSRVIELIRALTQFEQYSAECVQLSCADAELHGYLQQAAGNARSLLEAALERVALHEGLVFPA